MAAASHAVVRSSFALALGALALGLAAVVSAAPLPAGLAGMWNNEARQVTVLVQPDGSGEFNGAMGQWRIAGGALQFSAGVQSMSFRYTLAGDRLTLTANGDAVTLARYRSSDAPAPAGRDREGPAPGRGRESGPPPAGRRGPPPAATRPGAPPTRESQPAQPTHEAGAQRYREPNSGASFDVPSAWRVVPQKDMLMIVSNTEAGMMNARLVPGSTLDAVGTQLRAGLSDAQFQLRPSGPARRDRVTAGPCLVADLEGRQMSDGSAVRARVFAVGTPSGDVALFLAITTPPQFANLARRFDTITRSVAFERRAAAAGGRGGTAGLAGMYQYYHSYSNSSGSMESSTSSTLCPDGSFSMGGESSSSGNLSGGGSYGTSSGDPGKHGRWSATGDGSAGVLTLTFANGQTVQVRYQVSRDPKDVSGYGPAVYFDGKLYQKVGYANCGR